MNRTIQIVSGIAVFIVSLLNALAVASMVSYHGNTPTVHYSSLAITALAVALSFLGGYILVSGKAR